MQNLDTRHFFPQVLQAVPSDDYTVYAYFNDGSVRRMDMKPLIQPDTVFAHLRDINIFKSTLTVLNHTVAWTTDGVRDERTCVDLDPETVFNCPEADDPL